MYVCARQRAPIRHSNVNIPGKSTGSNLLSNVFHLLVSGQSCDSALSPNHFESMKIQCWGTKAKGRVHCSVFTKCTWILCCYSHFRRPFRSMSNTHALVQRGGKDTLTSTVKGRAITQYQIKAQSLRQPRWSKTKRCAAKQSEYESAQSDSVFICLCAPWQHMRLRVDRGKLTLRSKFTQVHISV